MANASMRDIYLNPTIAKLAAHLGHSAAEEPTPAAAPEPFHIPSDLAYYGCGALQLLFYAGYMLLGVWVFDTCFEWAAAAAADPVQLYARSVVAVVTSFFGLTAVSIVAKWLLIGRFKPESIPIWSLHYFRFWAVKSLIRTAPMALFVGHPIYNAYLRLLGAKIGRDVVVLCEHGPVCADLISIGDLTILRKNSTLLGYRAQSNFIHVGPVTIGSNAFVGEGSVVDIGTVMGNDTQLGHASSLQTGQHIPDGKRYHGTPAVDTKADYCPIERMRGSGIQRVLFDALELAALFAVVMPLPILLLVYWEHHDAASGTGAVDLVNLSWSMLGVSAVSFFGSLLAALLGAYAIPRLCQRFLQPDRTYPLFGVHYWLQTMVAKFSYSDFFNVLLGDSSAAVHYLRFLGWNLNKVEQTGSNFGANQKHDNPFLCDIGSGTMVSDRLSMLNMHMSSSSFRLQKTTVGEKNYFGNSVHYPPNGRTGGNCLIGSKTMIPIDGPVRENVGLLGSPCFEIPRMVERDKCLIGTISSEDRRRRLRQKNVHNLVTASLFLLKHWATVFFGLVVWQLALLAYPTYGVFSLFVGMVLISVAAILIFVLVARASLGFKSLRPQTVTIYDPYFWGHERFWKLTEGPFLHIFAGTPFQGLMLRMLGVKVGRKVYDAGCFIAEFSLTEIGDYANLNEESRLQAHSLEEGVFKSDYIRMGKGCTVGLGALVHYGATIGDHVVLDADSFLMKGEVADSYTTWRGNPARLILRRAPDDRALAATVYDAPDSVRPEYRIAAE